MTDIQPDRPIDHARRQLVGGKAAIVWRELIAGN
jgi:uncharacterized protein YheU (UPF0270 family)